ncbi:MAG: hypothetical protein JW751_21670 [Polyangiaceae bacterium]|nr:hypothetical protein [Polyangiaceae bacterium]
MAIAGLSSLALTLAGCQSEQAAARVDLGKVDAACTSGDQEAARIALGEAAAANRAFRDAYEEAIANWGGADPARINPCGVILEDLRRRLAQKPRQ